MPTPSKAQAGRGSIFALGPVAGTATPTYINIGEVSNIDLTPPSWATEDVTNLDSGSDAEFIATMRDGGEVSIDLNRVGTDAGQIALAAAADTGALYMIKITYPKTSTETMSGDSDTFNALVLSVGSRKIAPKNKISLTVKLKISGKVTETAGS